MPRLFSILLVLACSSAVCADLSPRMQASSSSITPHSGSGSPRCAGFAPADPWTSAGDSAGGPASWGWPDGYPPVLDDPCGTLAGTEGSAARGDSEVIQVPLPPGGCALCFSGLVSLAGVQLLRSARHHWVHPAVRQGARFGGEIVHADLLDPGVGVLALCPLEQPLARRPLVACRRVDLSISALISLSIPLVSAPRGPP